MNELPLLPLCRSKITEVPFSVYAILAINLITTYNNNKMNTVYKLYNEEWILSTAGCVNFIIIINYITGCAFALAYQKCPRDWMNPRWI